MIGTHKINQHYLCREHEGVCFCVTLSTKLVLGIHSF